MWLQAAPATLHLQKHNKAEGTATSLTSIQLDCLLIELFAPAREARSIGARKSARGVYSLTLKSLAATVSRLVGTLGWLLQAHTWKRWHFFSSTNRHLDHALAYSAALLLLNCLFLKPRDNIKGIILLYITVIREMIH